MLQLFTTGSLEWKFLFSWISAFGTYYYRLMHRNEKNKNLTFTPPSCSSHQNWIYSIVFVLNDKLLTKTNVKTVYVLKIPKI